MMVAYLAIFLGVSPFRETQDPRVGSKIDFMYRDSMHILDEVDNAANVKCMLAWYTKFPPKNTVANKLLDAVAAEAAAKAPPASPRNPARNVAWRSLNQTLIIRVGRGAESPESRVAQNA
jgi:hypothetical protein